MNEQADRYSRDHMIYLYRSGHLVVAKKESDAPHGSLPVFSADTKLQADILLNALAATRTDNGYLIRFDGSFDEIQKVSDRLSEIYQGLIS